MKMSIGVDLHKTQFTVCWRQENGKIEMGRFITDEKGYGTFEERLVEMKAAGDQVSIAVESTGNTRYFKYRMEAFDVRVVVVNTLKFKVINESVKKTDRHDAVTLAEFLEKDMLPEAKLCSRESEELRRLLKARRSLVETIVSFKNQIHGLLLSYGITTKRGELQSQKERRRVKHVLEAQQHAGVAVIDPLFDTIDRLGQEVKKLEKMIEDRVSEDPEVRILTTIPGVGLITGSTLRAYIDDITRFHTPKQLASYAGLVPWVQNSNETIRHGRITKHGPHELRTALVQAVLGMVRMKRKTAGYRLMRRYDHLKKIKGSGKSIIASARKLSEIIWHMLRKMEPFDATRMQDPNLFRKSIEMQTATFDVA